MEHSSSFRRRCAWLALAAVGCMLVSAPARAQAPQPRTREGTSDGPSAGNDAPALDPELQAQTESLDALPEPIGGGPGPVRGAYYTSPLKKLGTDIFLTSYVLGALSSFVYLASVYPLQALFGSSKLEPVMLWLLLPVAGPWFAQYEDSVRSKPFWRVVLVGDAVLQAGGIVLGLIGMALSGRRTPERQTTARPRPLTPRWQLQLGAAGAGLAGVTLSVRTL